MVTTSHANTTVNSRARAGFTLVELIVAVAIIAVLSTYVLVDYRATQDRVGVRLEAYRLASMLRRAQNYALGAYENEGSVPTGGWGVYVVNSNAYLLFADSGNYAWDASDDIVESYTLPEAVTFAEANHGDSFVFEPPDPTTYLNGVNQGERTVALQQTDDATNVHTVTVNAFGLVDID